MAGGSGLDKLESPAQRERDKQFVSRVGKVGFNPICMPLDPGDVQVLQRW